MEASLSAIAFIVLGVWTSVSGQDCSANDFSINYEGSVVFTAARSGVCTCRSYAGNGTLVELSANAAILSLQANMSALTARISALENTPPVTEVNGTRLISGSTPPVACTVGTQGYMWYSTIERSPMLCNGLDYVVLHPYGSMANPATSCFAIRVADQSAGSGMYWIDGDGPLGPVPPFQAMCDMLTDGGGWTVVWMHSSGMDPGDTPLSENRYMSMQFGPFDSRYKLRYSELQTIGHTEHIVYRGRTTWLKVLGGFFTPAQLAPTHSHVTATVESASGNRTAVYINHARINIGGGGWYSVSNGLPDHHSTSYYELNSGCVNDLVYVYQANKFGANFALSPGWTADGCSSLAASNVATSVAVRGNSADTPLRNCRELLVAWPSAPSGTYWLDPDGAGGISPFQAYCEMSFDGGGWTVVWSTKAGYNNSRPYFEDTINVGSSPYVVPYKISLSQLQSIPQTEHVLWRSSSQWLKVAGKFFSASQWPSHIHETVTIASASGNTATATLAHSNVSIDFGGWYAVVSGTPDHHNTKYSELNADCLNDYVYVYYSNMFGSNIGLGTGWLPGTPLCAYPTTFQATVIMIRGPVYQPLTSCKALLATYPGMRSGYHAIDPDGAGAIVPFDGFCDAKTDGGGWTMVYLSGADMLSTTITYIANTASIVQSSAEMMFTFFDATSQAVTSAWKFATPSQFRTATPMAAGSCVYVNVNATRAASGKTVSAVLRAGYGGFGSTCDDSCSGQAGQICLKSSATQGTAGGVEDFPMYVGFAGSALDGCSASSKAAYTRACDMFQFAIFVR